ncbi:MAG: biotin/lipoyl-containing protein, partial [Thalassolituus sp.]
MTTLKIPDLGGSSNVEVIEILVGPGDQIEAEQALIVLETDKATMEIPAETSGTVSEVLIKTGDKVSQGDDFLVIESGAAESESAATSAEVAMSDESNDKSSDAAASTESTSKESSQTSTEAKSQTINIPDLGGSKDVDVIEISVRVGEEIDAEQSIVTLETDKASMEIPAGVAGTVEE